MSPELRNSESFTIIVCCLLLKALENSNSRLDTNQNKNNRKQFLIDCEFLGYRKKHWEDSKLPSMSVIQLTARDCSQGSAAPKSTLFEDLRMKAKRMS